MKHLLAFIAAAVLATGAAQAEQKACSRIAKPVCVLKDGKKSTVNNACMAENAGASVLHDGACEGGDMCSMLYKPVCAISPATGKEETYSGICVSENANARIVHDGACKAS
ncbi:MAG TPA: hypothetical protein VMF58_05710 [Rhizomicrobium sp.]|nr:hypothetical protein [Rhizomicrobium sp.]